METYSFADKNVSSEPNLLLNHDCEVKTSLMKFEGVTFCVIALENRLFCVRVIDQE